MKRVVSLPARRRPALGCAFLGRVVLGLVLYSGCDRHHDRPLPLFDSRVPYEPLLDKLQKSGGDPERIQHPRSAADLATLKPGARYKFALGLQGGLAISPLPDNAPNNEYTHPVLAGGAAVRTAGGLRVERGAGDSLEKVIVDQDSQAYCPTGDSLRAALAALHGLGVPAERLRLENRPPQCPEPDGKIDANLPPVPAVPAKPPGQPPAQPQAQP